MLGRTLSHYRIVEKIGAGGMGEVYLAHDDRLQRNVALKILHAGALTDETARRRFRNEALMLSKLNHPNIAIIFDFDTQADVDFLVMEYLPGETLAERLKGGRLPEEEIVRLGKQVSQALEEAHEHGVVHRDLKPSTIAFTAKGHVKVLDFGIAKLVIPKGELAKMKTVDYLTQTAGLAGTFPYMAPEQVRGEAVDARTDVWALGVVLYEMVTGQRPFPQEQAIALIDAILSRQPPPPRERNENMSTDLESIIIRALAKNPSWRYQSAEALRVDLEKLESALAGGVAVPLRKWAVGAASPVRLASLAVLPLVNLSGDPNQEYFSDGMTDELIAQLTQLKSLRVISWTSAMRYKKAEKSLPTIARELNVETVLEGSVRRDGGRVRITVQLIDAIADHNLWAKSYERDLQDILRLQNEVASEIAKEVNVSLTPQEEARLAVAPSVDLETYDAYLRGRFHWNKRDPQGFKKAMEYFEQALTKNPAYAHPYAGLADTYNMLGTYSFLPPEKSFLPAKAAAKKALERDSALAEAHASLAWATFVLDADWVECEKEFKRALELKPGYASAHHWYAWYLSSMGRFQESSTERKQAQALDPLSLPILATHGWELFAARQFDQAIEQTLKALELDQSFPMALFCLGIAYVQKGEYEQGISALQRSSELSGSPTVLAALGHAYAVSGQGSEASRVLDELGELSTRKYVSPYDMAVLYAGLSEVEQAFESLEKACEDRAWRRVVLKVDPMLDPLRTDPRFHDILVKLNFPE